jgi:hypothetical protein
MCEVLEALCSQYCSPCQRGSSLEVAGLVACKRWVNLKWQKSNRHPPQRTSTHCDSVLQRRAARQESTPCSTISSPLSQRSIPMAVLERTSRRGANNTNQDGNPPRSLLLLRFMPFALLRPVSRKQRGKRIEQEITTNEGSRTRASEKNLTNPPNSEHRKIPEARTGQERTPHLTQEMAHAPRQKNASSRITLWAAEGGCSGGSSWIREAKKKQIAIKSRKRRRGRASVRCLT